MLLVKPDHPLLDLLETLLAPPHGRVCAGQVMARGLQSALLAKAPVGLAELLLEPVVLPLAHFLHTDQVCVELAQQADDTVAALLPGMLIPERRRNAVELYLVANVELQH